MHAKQRGAPWGSAARIFTPALLALALLWTAPTARAATRTVTSGGDSGSGTLRAAVAAANPGDTIDFDPGVTKVTLTGGEIMLTRPVTIVGDGVTVSAGGASRVFEVAAGPVALSDLTITQGHAGDGPSSSSVYASNPGANGGGVLVDANAAVTLSGCTLTGNSAGTGGRGADGIGSHDGGPGGDGVVTIGNPGGPGGGGGAGGGLYVSSGATVTLSGCTLTANSGGAGGSGGSGAGISGSSPNGGAILYGGDGGPGGGGGAGGGLYVSSGATVTLSGCTLIGNGGSSGGSGGSGGTAQSYFDQTKPGSNGPGGFSGDGGGVYSSGAVTLGGCALTGGSADAGGGLYSANGATATLTNCDLSNNTDQGNKEEGGGAIFNAGGSTLTLTRCRISHNQDFNGGGRGGGISNGGVATLTDCTLSDNVSGSSGGNYTGGGGGLYNMGQAMLNECTLSGNSGYRGGALLNVSGTTTLANDILYGNHSTYGDHSTDNSGEVAFGFSNSGSVSVSHCDIQDGVPGGTTDGGGNLSADPRFVRAPGTNGSADPGDLHLQAGSPCLGAGDGNAPGDMPFDLDGTPRRNPPTIGAYEIPGYPLVVTNTNATGPGSLAAAITTANATPGAVITFDPSVFGTSRQLIGWSATLNITGQMSIVGPGPGVILDAGGRGQIANVAVGGSLFLSGFTLMDGYADDGGALSNDGTLMLVNCTVRSNTAYDGGGALYNGGTATLTNCVLTGNRVLGTTNGHYGQGFGGAVFNGGPMTLIGCTFTGNTASSRGGALYNFDSLQLTNDIFWGDSAPSGPEIYDGGPRVSASYCDIGQSDYTGFVSGTGDFSADPLFVSAVAPYDVHLRPGSPCVGAGTAQVPYYLTDLDGVLRLTPPSVGAYEGQPAAPAPPAQTTQTTVAVTGSSAAPTVTATVADTSGTATPSGTVTFTYQPTTAGGPTGQIARRAMTSGSGTIVDSGVPLTASSTPGTATATDHPALPPGTYSITAQYVPSDGSFSGSSSASGGGSGGPVTVVVPVPDTTAPTTTASLTGPQGSGGRYTGPVTVTLAATDNASEVQATYYTVDGGPTKTYTAGTPVTVSGDGTHTVTFWSVDNAGNVEPHDPAQNPANTLTVKIQSVRPPVASPQTVSVAHNTPTAVTLTASDPNSPPLPLTYIVVSSPSHGTLSGTAPNLTYTPQAGYQGSDGFTYKVNNGVLDSSTATVTLNVAPGTPAASPQSVRVAFSTAKGITLTGADPDVPALPLTYAISANPAHGTLSGLNATTGTVTYTPNTGYQGGDSFSFTVNNGANTSSPAAVTLTVAAGVPTATPQAVSVSFGTAKTVTLTGTDPDVPALPLTFMVVSGPAHGTLSGTAPNLTYTPNAGYHGADSFSFTVNNGQNTSSAATVGVTVAAGIPTANAQSVTTATNTAKAITLTGSDPDVPALPLTYTVTSGPSHGTLSGTAPNLTYTPAAGYFGADSVTFTVSNGVNTSAPAKVSLTIADTVAPTVTAAADKTTLWPPNGKGVPVTISGRFTDAGSGVNLASGTDTVVDSEGTSVPGGMFTVKPDGTYSFTLTLTASRSGGDKDGRTYTVTVAAQDRAGNTGRATVVITVPHDQGK